jgi:predicted AAA+ superfamily ATPase
MKIERSKRLDQVKEAFEINPIVAILGPRQCGKTTLAQDFAFDNATFFDLEDLRDEQALLNPMLALERLEGLIVIDEIQMAPDLFKVLRVLIDKYKATQRYLILGSASTIGRDLSWPDIVFRAYTFYS